MMVIGTVEALYNGTNLILDATNSLHHAAGHAEGLIAGIAVSGGGVVVSGRGAEAVDEWVDNRHASGQ